MIARIPPPTTVHDLERYSAANPGWQIERDADGTIVMSPTNSESGRRNARLVSMLSAWNDRIGGGEVFDSSTGFTMPDGAVLSPDASWIRRERWTALSPEQRREYAFIVPDVCVELVSPSDTLERTIAKARRYLAYGAAYAVVLDPQQQVVWNEGVAPIDFPSDFDRVIGSEQNPGSESRGAR